MSSGYRSHTTYHPGTYDCLAHNTGQGQYVVAIEGTPKQLERLPQVNQPHYFGVKEGTD